MASSKPAIPACSTPATERVVFLGDVHFPHHDQQSLDLVGEFLKWFKPDHIYLIGDLLDCYAVSSFDKDPRRLLSLQEEIDLCTAWMRGLRKAHPKAAITFRLGNHEHRLSRYLSRKAPELSDLAVMNWPALLHLDELRIRFVDYNGHLEHRGFLVEHGDVVRQRAGYTAAAMLDKRGRSGITGHTHRLATHYKTNAGGRYVWAENGALCSMSPDYILGQPDWQSGFTVGNWVLGSKRFTIETVPIIDGTLYFAGRLWEARRRKKK